MKKLLVDAEWTFKVDARLWIEDTQKTSLTWLHPDVGIAHDPGSELHAELRNRGLVFVPKTHYSAFYDTDLEAELRRRGIEEVFIAGIQTDYCVASTAMAAFERRFRAFVVSDACTSAEGEEAHNTGLQCVRRYLGNQAVVTSDSL